jgi:protein transport protein SEC24
MNSGDMNGSVDSSGVDPRRKKRPARAHHQLGLETSQHHLAGFATQPFPQLNNLASTSLAAQSYTQPPPVNGTPASHDPVSSFERGPQATLSISSPPGDTLSVAYKRHRSSQEYACKTFKSFENTAPPPATTRIHCIDQGTATPKFARLTMNSVPSTEAIRNSTKLPLGLTVRPFAPQDLNEDPVPEVNLCDIGGPLRCRRCRTYLNPHMQFTHEQKFICNMCNVANPVPYEYQAPIDVNGRRVDYLSRSELHRGVVDYIVPQGYWPDENQPPNPLHHLFLLDVTAPHDVLRATTEAIRGVLLELRPLTKVGIIAYDQNIHFVDLNGERPQFVVLSDLDDIFVPIGDGIFVDPEVHSQVIYDTLNQIDTLFADFKLPEVAYGPALRYACETLRQVGGGKVTATLSKIPSWGSGALTIGENKNLTSDTFKCSNEFYQRLADKYLSDNVGLDLFVVSTGSIDLINSGNVVFRTAGTLRLYSNFVLERDEVQYIEDIRTSVLNTKGYQGQLKVRCSNGLQIASYYGNFDAQGSQDPILPVLTSDQQVSVLFSYDNKLDVKKDAHFQVAMLYTGSDGQRRVRVVNIVAAVTEDVSTVFAFADEDAVLDLIVKNCLHYISKQNPIEVKNSTKTKLVDIFSQYRGLACHSNLLPTQLVFPDSLNTLSAYINAFQKCRIFKTSLSNNLSIYEFHQLNSLPLEKLVLKLYPMMIDLVNLREEEACYDASGHFVMPENARLSSQSLSYGGAFFVFNGLKLFLWIHSAVSPLLLRDIYDVDLLEQIHPLQTVLPELNTHISQQCRNIVDYFAKYTGQNSLSIQICRQGLDGTEFEFGELLVEDRALDKTESYVEFVSDIHKRIRAKIDNDNVVKGSSVDESTLSLRFAQI